MKLTCQHCGAPMKRRTLSSGNCLGFAIALGIIAAGIGITIVTGGLGAIIGIPMVIAGLFIGGKKRRVWKCTKCGSIIDRA